MPTTLHPTIRYRTLDKCFQQKGRKWTHDELREKCGEALRELIDSDKATPCRRTIMTDIQTMRNGKLGYYAPIAYDRIEKGFYYSDPDFSIVASPLNANDRKLLQLSATILKQYRGFSQLLDLESIIQKIEHAWPSNNHYTKKSVMIQFDQTMENAGQHWLEPLLKAIESKSALDINYRPFHIESSYRNIFSPYLLKEYNHRWFLIGWSHQEKRIEVRALDRILQVQSVNNRFYQAARFDPDTYFNLIIGVTVREDRQLAKVQIMAHPDVAQYIHTKKLHHSQRLVSETPTCSLFEYRLIPNFELENVLLSFGGFIKVLTPDYLQEIIAKRLRDGAALYE